MPTPADESQQAAYDLFSAAFKRNPHSTFARMRAQDPVYRHLAPDGATIWYITRYEDVVQVLRDDVHFAKDRRRLDSRQGQQPLPTAQQRLNENMLFADPPDHTRLRALVSQAFTPARVAGLAPQIEAIVAGLLDRVADRGHMDLIADYALPLPVRVIGALLGVPRADQADVSDWCQAIISPGRRGLNYSQRSQQVGALLAYLQQMFAQRAAAPQDDLVTDLVQAEADGDRLTQAELSSMVALLLVTGHETTVNQIGNGVLALLQHPVQLDRLRREPSLWASAIEELLRFDGPVETSTTRWVMKEVTLRGAYLRRGDVVRVSLAAANRDETQFVAPDLLDLDRHDNRHLAFGLGIHYCLGAPLARLEARMAFPALFQRLGALRLAVPASRLQWHSGVLFRGLKQLPVTWSVARLPEPARPIGHP